MSQADEKEQWFRNYYRCEETGEEWQDDWTATCDDECPCCGIPHSPYQSDDIAYKGGPVIK